MTTSRDELATVYRHSDDVVAREIEGDIIIVPLVAGIGDTEGELFTLNDTGKAIWEKLDGRRTLAQVVEELSAEYAAGDGEIERDMCGLVEELAARGMVVADAPEDPSRSGASLAAS